MQRWLVRAVIGLVLMTSFAGLLAPDLVRAADPEGCDGYTDYRTAMDQASRDHVAAARDHGISGRSADSYSSAEWKAYSDILQDLQNDIKAIDAPERADAWHTNRISFTGLTQQVALTISESGMFSAIGYGDSFESAFADEVKVIDQISESCATFSAWAAAWDRHTGFKTDVGAPSETLMVSQSDDVITLTGNEHSISDRFELAGGRYIVTLQCDQGIGYAEFLGQDEDAYYPTVYDKESVEKLPAGFYRLEAGCGGTWTVTISPFEV